MDAEGLSGPATPARAPATSRNHLNVMNAADALKGTAKPDRPRGPIAPVQKNVKAGAGFIPKYPQGPLESFS